MSKRLKILVCNDDGIDALGIKALVRALSHEHEVCVFAPHKEHSGYSHCISFNRTIDAKKVDFEGAKLAYRIEGTPADCVKFALLHVSKDFDVVVSGINFGQNVGTDVLYSGTVAAAREAAYLGLRGIALSKAGYKNTSLPIFEACAQFFCKNLHKLLQLDVDRDCVLNINFPELEQPHGVKVTEQGYNYYSDFYSEQHDGRLLLVGESIAHDKNVADCDVEWLKKGYVTITPLSLRHTDYDALKKIRTKMDIDL